MNPPVQGVEALQAVGQAGSGPGADLSPGAAAPQRNSASAEAAQAFQAGLDGSASPQRVVMNVTEVATTAQPAPLVAAVEDLQRGLRQRTDWRALHGNGQSAYAMLDQLERLGTLHIQVTLLANVSQQAASGVQTLFKQQNG